MLVGRVILGHVSATIADLAQRGFLDIRETHDGTAPDWILTDLRGTASDHGIQLEFETILTDGLFARGSVI